MKVMSKHFKRPETHKGTWMGPNGEYLNQIDHIIIEKALQKVIKKIKSCRGADINSDHFLVKVKLKIQKWKKKTRKYRGMKQFDMEKLQLIDTQPEYNKEIGRSWQEIRQKREGDVNEK